MVKKRKLGEKGDDKPKKLKTKARARLCTGRDDPFFQGLSPSKISPQKPAQCKLPVTAAAPRRQWCHRQNRRWHRRRGGK